MSDDRILHLEIEPERYELTESPAYHFDLERRDFFKVFGAGLLVVCVFKDAAAQQESGRQRRGFGDSGPKEISAWLHIGENGIVTVNTGKVEVGQNIRTSLSQAVAEELKVDISKIQMVMGDTDLTPYDAGTFGSRSTPTMNLQLRRVASATRDLLVDMAAEKWQCDRKRLTAANGKIIDAETKREIEYSELVRGRQLTQTLPAENPLIPAGEWAVAGKPSPKVDGRDFVTGKHRYSPDQKLAGMLYGKIRRPPSFGATVHSADTKAAEQIAGVTVVHDGNFLGVAAPSESAAVEALATIRADWESAPQVSRKELFEHLKKDPGEGRGDERPSRNIVGSIEKGFVDAEQRLEKTYTVEYIAHVPLEPRAALAEWSGEKLTVWTGTQRPFGVRTELAEAFRMSEKNIRVIVPDTGSGYGGKHTGEAALEAARLARAAKRPVKVVWTREEEFTWAYFRPAGVIEIRSGLRNDGTITAWEFHNYNSGSSAIRPIYAFPNQHIEFHRAHTPLRQGSYRGLAATANHFARESHMDELAQLVKMDPLEFRLKNLKDERMRAVLEAAAKRFGWPAKLKPTGHGYGIGGGFEKGSYVASCAAVEVNRTSGGVKVVRVVTAFECGAVVNPDGLRNQIEGSIVMGLGGALFEAVDFENGKILNAALSKYRVPRFSDVPILETVLVNRTDLPSEGAGETPIVALAPAVGNAIFDATGMRLRSLPMAPKGLQKS